MDVYDSVLGTIGRTPLIRLPRLSPGGGAPIYAKAEFFNPGGSVKDRAALSMVTDAIARGVLRPGMRIVEGTSGNTGIGLAIAAAQHRHPMTVVVPDKTSTEKISTLRAYGAEVVVTVGGLPSEHPEHVNRLAARIAEECGGWLADQYDNPANPAAHVATTGPELWEQTDGRITHFVAGVGTGGTISGTGEYLKERSGGRVRVIGADPEYSVYAGGDGSPYFVEAIGHYVHPETIEDEWPRSYHREVVDEFERVGDRESILAARRLAREEGLLAGGSAGTAVAAALRVAARLSPQDLVVVLLPDTGRGYLTKYFDDDWLRQRGFLEEPLGERTVGDVVRGESPMPFLPSTASVAEAKALSAARPGPIPVTLPRTKPSGPASPAEVVGALDTEALDGATTLPVREAPPAVGIGEALSGARARIGGQDWAWVLLDGRVVAAISKEQLGG